MVDETGKASAESDVTLGSKEESVSKSKKERGNPVVSEEAKQVAAETSPVEADINAPVNLGAEHVTQIAKEIGETTGDPVRDKKLLEVHGSLYDPATSPRDTDGGYYDPNVEGDRVVTPQTEHEMKAGREALQARNSGTVLRREQEAGAANIRVDRPNVAEPINRGRGNAFPVATNK